MTSDETNRATTVAGETPPPQAADIRNRWWWVEHSVWTDRMLTRLEQSEPTTKWFRLWDKVLAERNLQAAFAAAELSVVQGRHGTGRRQRRVVEALRGAVGSGGQLPGGSLQPGWHRHQLGRPTHGGARVVTTRFQARHGQPP